MIRGRRIQLRPVQEGDWALFSTWGQDREPLWGQYQRHQIDHLTQLKELFQQNGMVSRQAGILIIETLEDPQVIGFVRYTMLPIPDSDLPYPEIGYGITNLDYRRQGYASEAVGLLVSYLFDGYPVERVAAFVDVENTASQGVMEKLGFLREGVLRRSTFRDGKWCDIAIYGLLREEWAYRRSS